MLLFYSRNIFVVDINTITFNVHFFIIRTLIYFPTTKSMLILLYLSGPQHGPPSPPHSPPLLFYSRNIFVVDINSITFNVHFFIIRTLIYFPTTKSMLILLSLSGPQHGPPSPPHPPHPLLSILHVVFMSPKQSKKCYHCLIVWL